MVVLVFLGGFLLGEQFICVDLDDLVAVDARLNELIPVHAFDLDFLDVVRGLRLVFELDSPFHLGFRADLPVKNGKLRSWR